jgi:uncharacterized membrane protein
MVPTMAAFHPQVVHFAIALLCVGVLLRAVSLLGRPAFLGPAAVTLLALGTVAVYTAALTGTAAHGPVEQMPGVRPAVMEHEEWGLQARNIFVVVLVIEVLALALRRSPRVRYIAAASTIVGVVGLVYLYEAAEHGGAIVYSYAGGVGTRSGDPADVKRLLLAGLYQQALVERKAGRLTEASALFEEAGQRFPGDVEVALFRAESLLIDRKDAAAALGILRAVTPPAENRFLRMRHGTLTADALLAAGQRDGAIATLQQLVATFPSPRIQQRLDQLQGKSGASGH